MDAILINETIDTLKGVDIIPYAPDRLCYDWCIVQQVTHSNNMELYAIMFIVFAYLSLVMYYIFDSFEKTRPYKFQFIYYAKLLLVLFLGFYILIIRMRLIW